PAQFTRPTSAPSCVAASTACLASASRLTSHLTNTPPSSVASALPASSFRSAIATLPPCSANRRAVAAPRPDAPPVIKNALPRISMLELLTCFDRGYSRLRTAYGRLGPRAADDCNRSRDGDGQVVRPCVICRHSATKSRSVRD